MGRIFVDDVELGIRDRDREIIPLKLCGIILLVDWID
jgi:hypothetical protein